MPEREDPRTELKRLADIPVRIGLPEGLPDFVKTEWFAGQHEAQLGKAVGMTQFGVNHMTLEPGAASALRHWHEEEDEFVYVLQGELVLIDGNGEHPLAGGASPAFPPAVPTPTTWSIGPGRPRASSRSGRERSGPRPSTIRTTSPSPGRSCATPRASASAHRLRAPSAASIAMPARAASRSSETARRTLRRIHTIIIL